MKIFQPNYVKDFKCDGKICGSHCCRDWKIPLDEETRQKYLSLPDCTEIFRSVDENARAFKMQSSGECPFLDENFLCKIQLRHGEGFLPAICQSFPRVTYDLGEGIFSQAMTLTCPVAAILILLQKEPITFEFGEELTARQIFDFTGRISSPEKFLSRQQSAIKILQQRELSINRRLENLCEFFGVTPCADFDEENHAAALAEIFSEMYDANLSVAKKNQLAETYRAHRKDILTQLRGNFSAVLENYLVNEFFMRCYPCAFSGGEGFNCRVFVTVYRAIEFATVLTAISQARLGLEDFLELLCALNNKLDHSKGGMAAIKNFAASHEGTIFRSLMIEEGDGS